MPLRVPLETEKGRVHTNCGQEWTVGHRPTPMLTPFTTAQPGPNQAAGRFMKPGPRTRDLGNNLTARLESKPGIDVVMNTVHNPPRTHISTGTCAILGSMFLRGIK